MHAHQSARIMHTEKTLSKIVPLSKVGTLEYFSLSLSLYVYIVKGLILLSYCIADNSIFDFGHVSFYTRELRRYTLTSSFRDHFARGERLCFYFPQYCPVFFFFLLQIIYFILIKYLFEHIIFCICKKFN